MDTQTIVPAPARPILELDLIADFACPWSFLGKRSLERALGNLYGLPVRALRWHGFRSVPEGTLLTVTETGFDQLPAARRARAYRDNDSGWAGQMENIRKYLASAA